MSNTFRQEYRELIPKEKEAIEAIKTAAGRLEAAIRNWPAGRYQSLAMTALEESVMWAVKHITQG